MNITKWDTLKFNRMMRRWSKKRINLAEIVEEKSVREALDFVSERYLEFFEKNPKAVYPSFMVNSIEETGNKLLRFDLAGFHMDVSMALGEKVYEARKLGRSPYHVADIYLADLIDYFNFYEDDDDRLITDSEIAVNLIRHLIGSRMYVALALMSQQYLSIFNSNFIFVNKPVVFLGNRDDEMDFINFCKQDLFDELGLEDMMLSVVAGWTSRALHHWIEGAHSVGEIEDKKAQFENDVQELVVLAKSFENVAGDQIGNPLEEISMQMTAMHITSDRSDGSDDDGLPSVVESSLKGFFAYLSIFKSLAHGYNIGAVSSKEWDSVMESFSDFRRHCIT